MGLGVADDVERGLLEDADELPADDLALLLGVADPGERGEELLAGVDHAEVRAGGRDEVALDLLGLALAHEPVVDVDAGEPVADGLLDECGRDRGVDPAGERAQRPPSPICARMRSTCSSTTFAVVQVGSSPAMSNRKCSSTVWPCAVCRTSGWNCTPARRRSTSSNAATGAPVEVAVTVNPGGAAETASPWLIHTDCSTGSEPNSAPPVVTVSGVPPNSRSPVRATVPPSEAAMAWKP